MQSYHGQDFPNVAGAAHGATNEATTTTDRTVAPVQLHEGLTMLAPMFHVQLYVKR